MRGISWAPILILAGLVTPMKAQFSPGPLSEPHAAIDSSRDCLKCHTQGKGVDPKGCLECHELLEERIRAGLGLHARPEYRQCETCHIDHHGRAFDLIWWGKQGVESFDHRETGYPLEGAHQVDCRSCHQASKISDGQRLRSFQKDLDRTFLGLTQECGACHRDTHQGHLQPTPCQHCHGKIQWAPADAFDHQATGFKLDGRHLEVNCEQCHLPQSAPDGTLWTLYRGSPSACASCHEDPHRGRLGQDCAVCHDTRDWNRVDPSQFDHDLTRYPLRGRHQSLACSSCHSSNTFRISDFGSCQSCHSDVHLGQFRSRDSGGDCAECHDVRGFVPSRFDRADHAATRFPLEPSHSQVSCGTCHVEVPSSELVERGVAVARSNLPTRVQSFHLEFEHCTDCHRDPHRGSADAFLDPLGCANCHIGASWTEVAFDHRATRYDLEGVHQTLACTQCHQVAGRGTAEVTLSLAGAPTRCFECHEDPHGDQFVSAKGFASCESCHFQEGWTPTHFDHDRSAFPLEGAHAEAPCGSCHREESLEGQMGIRYRPLPTECSACHRIEPVGEVAEGSRAR